MCSINLFELLQVNTCRHSFSLFLAVDPTALPLLVCPESVSASPIQKFLFPHQTHSDKEQVCPAASAFHRTTQTARLWQVLAFWRGMKRFTATTLVLKIDGDFDDGINVFLFSTLHLSLWTEQIFRIWLAVFLWWTRHCSACFEACLCGFSAIFWCLTVSTKEIQTDSDAGSL